MPMTINWSRRLSVTLVGLIIALGVGLRSWQLTARSLWFDEAFSWRLIQFSWPEMVSRAAADVHPPLYYLLLKSWSLVFASSLLSLRSFSVFFAALTILTGYLFATTAFRSRFCGLTTASLLAFAGYQVQYGWEARMYTLGTFLALLSSWLLLKGLRRPRPITWLLYSFAAAAFVYTHYFAFFTLAAHAIFILGYLITITRCRPGEIFQHKIFWLSLMSAALAAILFLPWLPVFLAQNNQVQESYWVPRLSAQSVPSTWYRFIAPTMDISTHRYKIWPAMVALAFIMSLPGWLLIASWRQHFTKYAADALWLVLLSVTTPFILAVIVSLTGQSLYNDRFFVFTHLFVLVAIAAVISLSPAKKIRYPLVFITILAFIGAYVTYWQELALPDRPGARAVADEIYTHLSGGETVLVSSPFVFFAIDHYAVEKYHIYRSLAEKPPGAPRLYSESGELSHFAGGPILTTDDLVGPAIFQNTNTSTIWVVDTTGFGSSSLVPPSPWKKLESKSFPEVFGYQGIVIVTKYIRPNITDY